MTSADAAVADLQKKVSDLTINLTQAQKEIDEQKKKIKKATDAQDTLRKENAILKDSWDKAEKRLTSFVDLDSTGPGVLEKTKQLDYPPGPVLSKSTKLVNLFSALSHESLRIAFSFRKVS